MKKSNKHLLYMLLLIVILTASVFLAACTGAEPDGTNETSATETAAVTAPAVARTIVELFAENLAFNIDSITVPAGVEVVVNFENMDVFPHNFAVYTDSSASESIFVGDIIDSGQAIIYTFTTPEEPGEYFFRCNVHPETMTGTFIVE